MAEEITTRANSPPTTQRRILTDQESAQFRRPLSNRFATITEESSPSTPNPGIRRRSSGFSDFSSLSETRRRFRNSTDDLLLPRVTEQDGRAGGGDGEGSNWQSAPLAFALLPALGGMFFQNGGQVVGDVMLLGLAAIFLNWSVRLPWDWYRSAQELRVKEEASGSTVIDDSDSEHEDDRENGIAAAAAALEGKTLESKKAEKPLTERQKHRIATYDSATSELYRHELLALLSCFALPILGAYLLHGIRGSLSRPSEGLISNFNLTIFILAAELRPMRHLVKLVQARTLHLQRVVKDNPYTSVDKKQNEDIRALTSRLETLETENNNQNRKDPLTDPTVESAQRSRIENSVRATLQPDLDALNRAVRRYEKRAALQSMQTEARLRDLETRLVDAISLAAVAAQSGRHKGIGEVLELCVQGTVRAALLPLQALGALAGLPLKAISAIWDSGSAVVFSPKRNGTGRGKGKVVVNGGEREREKEREKSGKVGRMIR